MSITTCIFCKKTKGSKKVHTTGAFIRDGELVDHYEGVAHLECSRSYSKWWYEEEKKRLDKLEEE